MIRIVHSISGLAICVTITVSMASVAKAQEESTDLFSMILIVSDLHDARGIMTMADPNEDGFIDKAEQHKLFWRNDIPQYDLNKDGKLTHLELAVRQAKLRSDSDVTFVDRKNAGKFMRRKDRNQNGQLDPDEIALGWPADPESMDTDGDGIITITEMAVEFAFNRSYRREMGILGVDQTEAIRLRNQFDKDEDGKLAPDEWPAANLPREPKQYDENKDGFLAIVEIATMLAKHRMESGLSKSDQWKARLLIRGADFNQDGKVTKEELEQSSSFNPNSKELAKYDANQDGEITVAEVEKSLGEARKEKGYSDEDLTAARRLLTRHDTNRSKFLEEGELLEEAGRGQLSARLMGKIDSDKDQKLSLEEIAKHLANEKK